MNLINAIKDFMSGTLDFFGLGSPLAPAVYIVAIGALLILIGFFFALIVRANGKAAKFRKQLDDASAYIRETGAIDENNVDGIYKRISDMPREVGKGWSTFLEQQGGYPSDYITEKNCVGDKAGNPVFRPAVKSFRVFSSIVILLVLIAGAIGCTSIFSTLDIADFKGADLVNSLLTGVLPLVGILAGPWLVYVILAAIISGANSSAYKKTVAGFRTFQDALDNNVIIFREAQDEFITENIEEINAAIEDILARKLDDAEILEIVTTPKIEEDKSVAEETLPEPVAPVETAVVAAAGDELAPAISKEEILVQLIFIAERAAKDPKCSPEQISEVAEILESARKSGDYDDPEKQDIFHDALVLLADAYYSKLR